MVWHMTQVENNKQLYQILVLVLVHLKLSTHLYHIISILVYQGANLATATATSTVHNYVTGSQLFIYRTTGTFVTSATVKGNTSGAIWNVSATSDTATMDNAFEDIVDNNRIETEADNVIDFTEHNPFGEV